MVRISFAQLAYSRPLDSCMSKTPWSVFQDGTERALIYSSRLFTFHAVTTGRLTSNTLMTHTADNELTPSDRVKTSKRAASHLIVTTQRGVVRKSIRHAWPLDTYRSATRFLSTRSNSEPINSRKDQRRIHTCRPWRIRREPDTYMNVDPMFETRECPSLKCSTQWQLIPTADLQPARPLRAVTVFDRSR